MGAGTLKVYVSVDMEGLAGVVHWDQIMSSGGDVTLGRALLAGELQAVCRGAVIAGAEAVVVNDAHSHMRNIDPLTLEDHVQLISGHFKPMYMMEGLDETFQAAVFLGYHGSIGSSSVLSHTYNPNVIWEARLNGRVTGETGINALVAHHYRVPVVLLTGDDVTVKDAKHWVPEATTVQTKTSLSRFAASSMTPGQAHTLIFAQIQAALSRLTEPRPVTGDQRLELTFQSADMATVAEWTGQVRRVGDRRVVIEATDGLSLYRTFHTVLLLARSVVDG